MRIHLTDDEPVEIQMAPLIDCVFLLLIFFLVASTLKVASRELRLELPAASAAVRAEPSPRVLTIAIDREGQVHLDGRPVDQDELLEAVRRQRADDPQLPVRLSADRRTPYEVVLGVLDLLRLEGITGVGLQTTDAEAADR